MAIEVFNRYEQKYLLTHNTFLYVNHRIKQMMEADPHSKGDNFYPICNIYYDTEDCALIRTSLEKPAYKEKLRLRAYGKAKETDLVFLEIKKKYKKLVNKRRSNILLSDAERFIQSGNLTNNGGFVNQQVLQELSYFVAGRVLVPKAFVAYDRIAYFDKGNHDLRISFDKNLRGRTTRLALTEDSIGTPIVPKDTYVLEVKTRYAAPLWLTSLLTETKVHRQSFSKYGTFFLNEMVPNKHTIASSF